jgi:hypothetical protein
MSTKESIYLELLNWSLVYIILWEEDLWDL